MKLFKKSKLCVFIVVECLIIVINNRMFSIWDQDNDIVFYNCVYIYKFGWWYRNCVCVNVNGLYLLGEIIFDNVGVIYIGW